MMSVNRPKATTNVTMNRFIKYQSILVSIEIIKISENQRHGNFALIQFVFY
jgi:hypothetical protein